MMNSSETKGSNTLPALLGRMLDRVTLFCLVLSGVLLGLLLFSYVFEVILRYFFASPTTWSFDIGKALMSTSVILALPEITRNHGNITIDVLLEKLPLQAKNKVKRVISFVCFFVCMATVWMCLSETMRQYTANIETFWNNPIPKWWISVFIPSGFLLSGLHFLKHGLGPRTAE